MIEVGITVRADNIEEIREKLAMASDMAVCLFDGRADEGEKDRRVATEETVKSSETSEKLYISVCAIAFETPDVIREIATKKIISGGPAPHQQQPTQLRPV